MKLRWFFFCWWFLSASQVCPRSFCLAIYRQIIAIKLTVSANKQKTEQKGAHFSLRQSENKTRISPKLSYFLFPDSLLERLSLFSLSLEHTFLLSNTFSTLLKYVSCLRIPGIQSSARKRGSEAYHARWWQIEEAIAILQQCLSFLGHKNFSRHGRWTLVGGSARHRKVYISFQTIDDLI